MSFLVPNYWESYFKYPSLEKIHGEPTFESLTTIFSILKSNFKTVYSDIGGGANGHIGLVLSLDKYSVISLITFIRPLYPGFLVILTGTSQFIVTAMQEKHKEYMWTFK